MIFLLISCLPLAGLTKTITAYKTSIPSGSTVPDLTVSIRLVNSMNREITESGETSVIGIPISERNTAYAAFSWYLSGNAYEDIYITFTFGQMRYGKDSNPTSESTRYIPYEVRLVHDSSTVDNAAIPVNAASNLQTYKVNSYSGTSYRFYYADGVTNAALDYSSATPVSVTTGDENGEVKTTVTYNMHSNTVVKNTNGQVVTSYSLNVCDYWNRSGTAYVTLKATSSNKWTDNDNVTLSNGNYYAPVYVEVSKP